MHKIIKYLGLFLSIVFLTACSVEAIQKIADKMLPEPVKTNAVNAVDAVLQNDPTFFLFMRDEKMNDDEFTAVMDKMFSNVSTGAEIRRDIVSASSQSNISSRTGKRKDINIIYEIQTEGGFTVVILDFVQTPEMSECCELTKVYVDKSDVSPYRTTLEIVGKIMKIIGFIFLLGLGVLLFTLVRWSRRKKAL